MLRALGVSILLGRVSARLSGNVPHTRKVSRNISRQGVLSQVFQAITLEIPPLLRQPLGLTPHAMLDFLATDDVISQIDGGGITSPLRSARQELGKELNNEQRLEAAAAAEAGKK